LTVPLPTCDEKHSVPFKTAFFIPTIPIGLEQAPFLYSLLWILVTNYLVTC
jgi:hypothetical protein